MSSVDTIIRRVLEDEDDDFSSKEMEVNLMRIGDRVLIANGHYAGDTGTVVGRHSADNQGTLYLWVHLDSMESPSDAIIYPITRLDPSPTPHPPGTVVKILAGRYAGRKGYVTGANQAQGYIFVHPVGDIADNEWRTWAMKPTDVEPLAESEIDDDDEVKSVTNLGEPCFKYRKQAGDDFVHHGTSIPIFVYADGVYIGTIAQDSTGRLPGHRFDPNWTGPWAITYSPIKGYAPRPSLATREEASMELWKERIQGDDLPLQDHLNVIKLVTNLTEDFDDEQDMKDLASDPLGLTVDALKAAGFTIEHYEMVGDIASVRVSWPAPDAVSYISGGKRARQIINQYMPLRFRQWQGQRVGHTATLFFTKKVSINQAVWTYEREPGYHARMNLSTEHAPGFYTFKLNDHEEGKAYCPQGDSTAGRILEEMVLLHSIWPFNPEHWTSPGDNFGSGPALDWWRKNREQLPTDTFNFNSRFFDLALTRKE